MIENAAARITPNAGAVNDVRVPPRPPYCNAAPGVNLNAAFFSSLPHAIYYCCSLVNHVVRPFYYMLQLHAS
jgi:hypothetical protein